MAPLGFDPRTIDTMEVCEVASILRRYEDDDEPGAPGAERDLAAERMAHHEAMVAYSDAKAAHDAGTGPDPGPPPEPPQPDPPRPDPEGTGNLGFMDLGPIGDRG